MRINNGITILVGGLLLGFGATLSSVAQGNDRSEILRAIQSGTSEAAFTTARNWLAGDNDHKFDWWLKGNEKEFASCSGETFILRLADWQKDALWLKGSSDPTPSWYTEELQSAQKHCIDQLIKANIGRCAKTGDRAVCKAP